MKRIIIERLVIYTLAFCFCLTLSIYQGAKSADLEQKFKNNVATIMKKYNYVKDADSYYGPDVGSTYIDTGLTYIKDNNTIEYDYNVYDDGVETDLIRIRLYLNYTDDLENIFLLLKDVYGEDVSIYQKELQELIQKFAETGEEQHFSNLNSDRQIVFNVEAAEAIENDYYLYSSINYLRK